MSPVGLVMAPWAFVIHAAQNNIPPVIDVFDDLHSDDEHTGVLQQDSDSDLHVALQPQQMEGHQQLQDDPIAADHQASIPPGPLSRPPRHGTQR